MRIRRFGNKMLDDSFETEMEVGEFSRDLTKGVKNNFVKEHNLGVRFIELFEQIRENPHISEVSKILEEMEKEYILSKYEKNERNHCR